MAKRTQEGVMVKNDGTPAKGWGGKRARAGRRKQDIPFNDRKRNRTIYCTAGEQAYLRAILTRVRAFRTLLDTEPTPGHEERYNGTADEWEAAYEKAKVIDLQEVADHLT